MRFRGRIVRLKKHNGIFSALLKSSDGANYIIPAQKTWFPGLMIDFGGWIKSIDDIGICIHTNWIEVGELNV